MNEAEAKRKNDKLRNNFQKILLIGINRWN